MKRPLVYLHGFAGTGDQLKRHLPEAIAPTLEGHGPFPACLSQGFEEAVSRLLDAPHFASPVHLIGYSMGGRIALALALQRPDLVSSLTLVGASPGPRSLPEREERRAWELSFVDLLEQKGLQEFLADWEKLPLFAREQLLPDDALNRVRRARREHRPEGLAHALRVLGHASMPDYRPRLLQLTMPVRLVVGALDTKFLLLAQEMAEAIPRASLHVVPGAGHNPLLETPDQVLTLLQ